MNAPERSRGRSVEMVVAFARAAREAGLRISVDRVGAFTAALGALDARRHDDVYWAGRLTLCSQPDDFAVYDRLFHEWFEGGQRDPLAPASADRATGACIGVVDGTDASGTDGSHAVGASPAEVLRRRDVASLSESQQGDLKRLIDILAAWPAPRPTRRYAVPGTSRLDRAATLRRSVRRHGEIVRPVARGRRRKRRHILLLIDVSGSMNAYVDQFLRFGHAVARQADAAATVWALGTRLTDVSMHAARRRADEALQALGQAVVDRGGGTRLGACLEELLSDRARSGTVRGAIVVVLSDGWERGEPSLLGDQMARLSRLARHIIWANPRKAQPGYRPLAGGMAAALPHVDEFVPAHSVADLERLARIVLAAARRV